MMSERLTNRAYFSLGSNIDAATNLPAAVRELSRHGRIAAVSNVWETTPVGFADQANFLNAAVLLETGATAEELREMAIPAIERNLGRVRDPRNRNAPRTIDVDLVLYNREVFQIGARRIPDPDLLRQAFIAIPLAEIDPDYVHPVVHRALAEIAGDFANVRATIIPRPDVQLAANDAPAEPLHSFDATPSPGSRR